MYGTYATLKTLIKKLDNIKKTVRKDISFYDTQKNAMSMMSYTDDFESLVSPWFIAEKVDYKLIFYPLLHVTYLRSWRRH